MVLHVQEHVLDHAAELFEEGDLNHDGSLSCNEILLLMRKVVLSFSHSLDIPTFCAHWPVQLYQQALRLVATSLVVVNI